MSEYRLRKLKKTDQYIVHNDNMTKFLCCDKYVVVCKALRSNSHYGLLHEDNTNTISNAKIVYNERDHTFCLIATQIILHGTEILHARGRRYV